MAVKIKSLNKKPTSKRTCTICGKEKLMEKFQRFCSPTCRQQASEIDRFGNEHKVALNTGKR